MRNYEPRLNQWFLREDSRLGLHFLKIHLMAFLNRLEVNEVEGVTLISISER